MLAVDVHMRTEEEGGTKTKACQESIESPLYVNWQTRWALELHSTVALYVNNSCLKGNKTHHINHINMMHWL